MFEDTPPKTLLLWVVVAALAYLLLPFDLLPDLLGLPGRIDDVAVIAWLFWLYRQHAARFEAGGSDSASGGTRGPGSAGERQGGASGRGSGGQRHGGASGRGAGGERRTGGASGRTARPGGEPDPYSVLGIPRTASDGEIQAAYRARMREYHPDKVAHLGEELQKLAHRKSQEIQRAYQKLRR
jgi:DnaJ-domain-containing protein 1